MEELVDAAYDNNVEEAEKLLAGGADVNATDGDGSTPLYEAVRKKSYATVALLLRHGADTNKRYNRNLYSVLHMAVSDNDQRMLELLLPFTADINIRDRFGNNALWSAIHEASLAKNQGNTTLIELLLKYGADPYTPNQVGDMRTGKGKETVGKSSSPYDSAVSNKLTNVLRLIEQYAPKPA